MDMMFTSIIYNVFEAIAARIRYRTNVASVNDIREMWPLSFGEVSMNIFNFKQTYSEILTNYIPLPISHYT